MSVREVVQHRLMVLKAFKVFKGAPGMVYERSGTVDVTADAVARILAMDDGLPAESIEYPPMEAWPWADKPVMLLYEQPVRLEFFLSSVGVHRCAILDEQDVQAHLIVPPGVIPTPEMEFRYGGMPDADRIAALEEQIKTSTGMVAALHGKNVTSGYFPFGTSVTTGGLHMSTTSSDRFGANLIKAISMRLVVVSTPKLTQGEQWYVTSKGSTTLQRLDIPRVGSTVNGTTPAVFKNRQHFTAAGIPKKPLTIQRVKELQAMTPELNAYTCPVCGQLHVGNSR